MKATPRQPAHAGMAHIARATKLIAAHALFCLGLAGFSLNLAAQQLYRSVDADGKVTFSDQPPPKAPGGKVSAARAGKFADDAGNATLPLELRNVVGKYPVTLYTGKDCAPCGSGRAMLSSRGIPYTEKTIETREDAQALERVSGDTSLPLLTIGGQQLKGYSDQEWSQYLDAAGYPKTSQLPANYRKAAPSPLVARIEAPTQRAEAAAEQRPVAAPAPAPAGDNPAGIKF
jgi:glutaredoxin